MALDSHFGYSTNGHIDSRGGRRTPEIEKMTTQQFPRPPLLSARQTELCSVLERLTAERGFVPSVREIAAAMNVHPSRVSQLARSAAAKGAIAWEPGTARSWRVVRQPLDPKGRRPRS